MCKNYLKFNTYKIVKISPLLKRDVNFFQSVTPYLIHFLDLLEKSAFSAISAAQLQKVKELLRFMI